MNADKRRLGLAVAVAALFWFYMFNPWTQGRPNFWLVMSCAAVVLTTLALRFTADRRALLKAEKPLLQLAAGSSFSAARTGVSMPLTPAVDGCDGSAGLANPCSPRP